MEAVPADKRTKIEKELGSLTGMLMHRLLVEKEKKIPSGQSPIIQFLLEH